MYKLTCDYSFQGDCNEPTFSETWAEVKSAIREEAEITAQSDELFHKRVSWDVTTAKEIKGRGMGQLVATQYRKSDTKSDYEYYVEWVEIEELIEEWYYRDIDMAVKIWNTTHDDSENYDENQTLIDVANHGGDHGVSGFIYYVDTIKFAKTWFDEIMEIVKEDCDSFGQDLQSFLSSFNCLDAETVQEAMIGGLHRNDTVLNALAWYALEDVAQAYENR